MQRMAAKENRLLMCSVCIRTALIWLLKTYFYAFHLASAICIAVDYVSRFCLVPNFIPSNAGTVLIIEN